MYKFKKDTFCRANDRVCRAIHSEENILNMKSNAHENENPFVTLVTFCRTPRLPPPASMSKIDV